MHLEGTQRRRNKFTAADFKKLKNLVEKSTVLSVS